MRHYEGQLCGKKDQFVRQKRPIVWQSILNFKCFGGLLNGVLIGILVYSRVGTNISS